MSESRRGRVWSAHSGSVKGRRVPVEGRLDAPHPLCFTAARLAPRSSLQIPVVRDDRLAGMHSRSRSAPVGAGAVTTVQTAPEVGAMYRYVVGRLVQSGLLVLVVITLSFTFIQLAPGDPVLYLYGSQDISAEVLANIRHEWG